MSSGTAAHETDVTAWLIHDFLSLSCFKDYISRGAIESICRQTNPTDAFVERTGHCTPGMGMSRRHYKEPAVMLGRSVTGAEATFLGDDPSYHLSV
jgi:hypothetical protein